MKKLNASALAIPINSLIDEIRWAIIWKYSGPQPVRSSLRLV
jgi:hypothetical protein